MKSGFALGAASVALFLIGLQVGLAQSPTVIVQPEAPAQAETSAEIGASFGDAATVTPSDDALAVVTEAAREAGYSAAITPGEFGTYSVTLAREGQSEETHGLLQKRWQERETIELIYVPTDEGLQATSATRTVEQKPPIGQWQTVISTEKIPADLLFAPKASETE
jgi:hypothetical protein